MHSLKVAVKASDVKSVYQSGLDIIIVLNSGEQIVLREAALRALTDPQFVLQFQDQEILLSALLNPSADIAVGQAAPVAPAEAAVAAPAEAVQDAPLPVQLAASEPAPIAVETYPPITHDQYLGKLPTSDRGFAMLPWLLGSSLLGGLTKAKSGDSGSTTPSINQVAISGANGIQNHSLNAGDEVIISVTLSEVVTLGGGAATALNSAVPQVHANEATNSGVPTLTLNIGGTMVQASYLSGSGSNTLLFHYIVQSGQNDSNGISIDANSLSLNGATLTNAAGNAASITHASVADNPAYLVDTIAPGITAVNMSHNLLAIGDTAQVTFTFSEPLVNFDSNGISMQNGKLGPLTSSDQIHWSGSFTPTAGIETSSNVVTVTGSFSDAAGNTSSGSTNVNFSYSIDTVRPTASITMASKTLAGNQTSLVTFTFSEPVTDFSNNDLTVANGTLSDVTRTGNGTVWTATFTPEPDTVAAHNVITLRPDAVADLAGNANASATSSANYSINIGGVTPPPVVTDTTAPTLSISMSDKALTSDKTALVVFTFSEPVTDFSNSDLSFTSGTLTDVANAGNGSVWIATFTPTPDTTAPTNVITLSDHSVFDLAHNANSGTTSSDNYSVNTVAVTPPVVTDTTAPTLTITMSDKALTSNETTLVVFTFSEPVTDFSTSDLSYTSGTLTDVSNMGNGSVWIATFTPTPNTTAPTNVITLSDHSVFDLAHNANSGTTSSDNYSVNTVTVTPPPVPTPTPTGVLTINGLGNTSLAENAPYISTYPSASGAVGAITYSLQGDDKAQFTVAADGVVRMVMQNYEVPLDLNHDNQYNYTLTVTDANNRVATQPVVVTVTNVNEAPTVAPLLVNQTATQDTAFSYTLAPNTFTDVDTGTTLSYSATLASGANLPSWLSFDAVTGSFSGTPLNADVGTISVKVTASDGALAASDSFTLAVANVNDNPTGNVIISGSTTQGAILTASHNLADIDGLGTISYQWSAGVNIIPGATNAFYVLTATEVGKTLTVAASYTDGHGTHESVSSAASTTVTGTTPTGVLTISGLSNVSVAENAPYTAAPPSVSGAVGAITYQLLGDDAARFAVDGNGVVRLAAQNYEVPIDSNQDNVYHYTLQATDANGNVATQALVVAVSNVDDAASGTLSVTGTAAEDGSLAAALTAVSDPDGITSTAYQWQENNAGTWTNITGASNATLTIPGDQSYVGKSVHVVASTTDALGGTTAFTSAAQTIANVDDAASGTLAVTGTAAEGGSLVAALTAVSDADGNTSTAYQWQENLSGTWTNITGASNATLTIPSDQSYVGKSVHVVASTTDALGGTTAFTSAAQTIANVDDAASGTLAVTGTAAEGGSLVAALTAVSDADGSTTTAYQWQEDIAGTWTDISGKNTATLAVPSDQSYVGKSVHVVASTTDALGGTTAFTSTAQTIANVDDAASGTLAVTGTPEEGGSLVAALTAVSDADGSTSTAYQWQENLSGIWTDISGKNTDTLTIPSDQSYVGKSVHVVASTTDILGGTTAFTSTAQTIANVNNKPTGIVIIGGSATQGTILTANAALADADGIASAFSYQWQAGGIDIIGATDFFYVLTQAEVGKTLTVAASYTDGQGTHESVTSSASASVTNINDQPIGHVTISGTATQGATLTASNTLTDADGMGVITYRWFADDVSTGATGVQYTLPQSAVGKQISVKASYTDGYGFSESVFSSATNVVTNVDDVATGTLNVAGTPEEGATLVATLTSVSDADGSTSIAYQWQESNAGNWTNIAGASSATLTIPGDQSYVGKSVHVVATTTDILGGTTPFTSAAQTINNVNDAPTGGVAISGTMAQGQTLTAVTNTLADADGLGALSYSWFATGSAISGATADTYTLTATEVGKLITVTASYTDGFGHAESVSSTATTAVAGTTAPTLAISNNLAAGQMVTDANPTVIYTFAFTENVAGFDSGKVNVTGGGKGVFTAVNGKTYTLAVTADDDSITNLSVGASNTGVTNIWGVSAASAINGSQAVDTRNPTVTITTSNTDLVVSQADQTVTYTLSFSEAVATLTAADLTISGGDPATGVTLAGDGLSATFSVKAYDNSTANLSVSVNNSVLDLNGNALVAVTNVLPVDTKAPLALLVQMSPVTIKSGAYPQVTFSFNEEVKLVDTAVTAPSGTFEHFSTFDNKVWYAYFKPTEGLASKTDMLTVNPTFTDMAGNVGVGTTSNYNIDTQAPTVSITMSKSVLHASETATVTFTFNEDVNGLNALDVNAGTGVVDNFTKDGTGKVWTARFTPTDNTVSAVNVIGLRDNSVYDAADNYNTVTASSLNYSIDTRVPDITPPQVTFASFSQNSFKIADTAQVLIVFSEGVTGFDLTDITADYGTVTSLSPDKDFKIWTATFKPNDPSSGTLGHLKIAGYTDLAATPNQGAQYTSPWTYSVDTVRPTVGITFADTALKINETSSVTFIFSEVVSGFTNSDLTINGGGLTNVSMQDTGTRYTATFTPSTDTESPNTVITLKSGMVQDSVGNLNLGDTNSPNYAIDTKAPTLNITSNVSTLKAGEVALITFTFIEALYANSFVESDAAHGSGTWDAGTFKVDPTNPLVYTATFRPTADLSSGTASITVAAGAYLDAAGNNGLAITGPTPAITIDTLRPTLTTITAPAQVNATATPLITFSFSEALTASTFTADDVAITGVVGGSLGSINGSGATYYATYTPPINTASGTVTFTVAANQYLDSNGNLNTAVKSQTFAVDTINPTVGISTNVTALKSNETAIITFTFSEDPVGFGLADITAAAGKTMGGTMGSLSTISHVAGSSDWVVTSIFTPTPTTLDAGSTASISVPYNYYTDSFLNPGAAGSLATTLAIDTKAPTLSITPSASVLKGGETSTITFSFSETLTTGSFAWDPTNLVAPTNDITLTGGTLGALSTSDNKTYTALFTPTDATNVGSGTISVAASKYQDAAGNNNTGASNTSTISYDTKAPTLTITNSALTNPLNLTNRTTSTITFTFSEAPVGFDWDPTGVLGDIVIAGGTLGAFTGSPTALTRTAIFTPTPNQEGPATASITVAGGSYTDAAFNTGGAGQTVMNIDTKAPDALSGWTYSGDGNATINKTELAAGFTISGSAASDVSVSLGSFSETLYSVSYGPSSGGVRTWTLNIPTTTMTYLSEGATRNDTLVSTDLAGNTASAALNIYRDTGVPTLSITRSGAGTLKAGEASVVTFAFSETLTPGSFAWDPTNLAAPTNDITLTGGTLGALSTSDNKTYTALFTPTVDTNAGSGTISVAATKYQDAAGNDNSAASNTVTINYDTKAPTLTITNSVGNNTLNLTTLKSSTIYFTFSENVTGFDSSDITVSGGTLSNFYATGTGYTYYATFTPTAGLDVGSKGTVTVAGGAASYTDTIGNPGSAGLTPTINIDTVAPGAAIATTYTGLRSDNILNTVELATASVQTFTISGSKAEDASVTMATFSYSYTGYTYSYRPSTEGAGNTTIGPGATSWSFTYDRNFMIGNFFAAQGVRTLSLTSTDAAGNTTPSSVSIITDIAPPHTVSITAPADLTATTPNPIITFNFSDAPGSSFALSRVTINDGFVGSTASLTDLSFSSDGLSASAIYHPDPLHASATTIFTVAANTYTDLAGNSNLIAKSLTLSDPTHCVFQSTAKALVLDSLLYVQDATNALVPNGYAGIKADATVYDANATVNGGVADAGITYTLSESTGFTDASLFHISQYGAVSFAAPLTKYNDAHGTSYHFTITATVTATGAQVSQDVTLDLATPATSIAIYSDVAHTQSLGTLSAPAPVDGGSIFYNWDIGSGRMFAQTELNSIFKYDSQGNLNPDILNTGTTDAFRYATVYTGSGQALQVALPTLGNVTGVTALATDVGLWNQPGIGSTAANPRFNDLLAIWDAFNTDTVGATAPQAVLPTGWPSNSEYLTTSATRPGVASATPVPGALGSHYNVMLGSGNYLPSGTALNGGPTSGPTDIYTKDWEHLRVVLQVL